MTSSSPSSSSSAASSVLVALAPAAPVPLASPSSPPYGGGAPQQPPPAPEAEAGGAGSVSGADDSEQPESLGLELDLWEGQFEFVGPDYGEFESPSPPPSPTRRRHRHLAFYDDAEDSLQQQHLKVQMLQQQVSVLADNQTNTDDRYTRAKQDSAALQARVHMLEEQLREAELRAEERLQEEQRRHREMMARVDREKELHVENYSIRLQTLELEASSLREETCRLRAQMERLRGEKAALEERLSEAEAGAASLRAEAGALRDGERRARDDASRDHAAHLQLVEELSRELEVLRKDRGVMTPTDSQDSTHLAELQGELNRLRQENKSLQETNEDLQAQLLTRGVEEGRNLLGSGNSIAAELEAMTGEELPGSALGHMSYEKMRTALKEQQEVNTQLRSYIDGMLLNIVENYPQLLEVKTN